MKIKNALLVAILTFALPLAGAIAGSVDLNVPNTKEFKYHGKIVVIKGQLTAVKGAVARVVFKKPGQRNYSLGRLATDGVTWTVKLPLKHERNKFTILALGADSKPLDSQKIVITRPEQSDSDDFDDFDDFWGVTL